MGANYWSELMKQKAFTGTPGPIRFDEVGPLKDGQHRLAGITCVCMLKEWRRRRRIVRVATLKYRARRGRR
jgi:hypothetical protein